MHRGGIACPINICIRVAPGPLTRKGRQLYQVRNNVGFGQVVRHLQKERIYMENLTRYDIFTCQCGCDKIDTAISPTGEWIKFSDVKDLLQTDAQQPQLEMPCESDYMLWCSMQGYNQAEAASIYRYIAQHIKRVR
jgi:hypothetical protein